MRVQFPPSATKDRFTMVFIIRYMNNIPGSFKGRKADFESVNGGSSPPPGARKELRNINNAI